MKWTAGPGGKGFHKGDMGAKTFPKVESPGPKVGSPGKGLHKVESPGHGQFPKVSAPGGGMSPKVRERLHAMGMSQMGIQQLAAGQMPSTPDDRKLVAGIVNSALGG